MSQRYVIIGSGVAAVSAAQAIHENDPGASTLMIGDDPHGFYSRPGLAYYLSGEIPENMLFSFQESDFRQMNIQRRKGRVERVLPDQHRVELDQGTQIAYDRLLLATGSRAVLPRVAGADLDGVVKLDHLEDARQILKLARRARAAVVVGGGITALEIVEGLVACGVQVHYFLRGERYWNNVLDDTESRLIEERLKAEKVNIHYRTELECIEGNRGKVVGVVTRDGRRIACGIVAFAIGVQPQKSLAEKAGLQVDRGILVTPNLQTSHPDIFSAGDVAQVYDPYSGKTSLDTLWNLAREQGRTAGINMAGVATLYEKSVPFNVTRLAGLTTTIIGKVGQGRDDDLVAIARGDSETWRELPDSIAAFSQFEINRLRLLMGKSQLVGAIIMGDQRLSIAIRRLIGEQVDITPIRSQLLRPGCRIADLLADFCSLGNRLHAAKRA